MTRIPTILELSLLACHDAGIKSVPCFTLADIIGTQPTVLNAPAERDLPEAWRICLVSALKQLGLPEHFARRVAAQHPGWNLRTQVKDLRAYDEKN